jgi:hypothetical protein
MGRVVNATSVALPKHSWPRHSSLLRTAFGVMLGMFGVLVIAGSFTGRYRLPAFSGWSNVFEGLLWIALGTAVWKTDQPMLRRSLALFLIATGASAFGFMVWGSTPGFSPIQSGKLIVLFALGVGVWNAREWARRGCIVLGLFAYGYKLSSLAVGYRMFGEQVRFDFATWVLMVTMSLLVVIWPLLALAIYGVLPSTRIHFAEAREAITRTRAMRIAS